THSTNLSSTKVDASKDMKKDVSSLRYIVLPNWGFEEHLESTSSLPQGTRNTDAPESSGNLNPTATSINPPDDQLETLTVETPILTASLPVPTVCFTDSQEPLKTPSLENILTLTNQFEDLLGDTSNSEESNGVEADVNNMEITITASPTPTLRIHMDHPKSQIISPVDTPIQTRNKSKEEEGIDYDEVFAPVTRIEAIRLFLAYASFMGFTVYQMDVKTPAGLSKRLIRKKCLSLYKAMQVDTTNQEVKKDVSSLRYIALPNWVHDALLESSSTDQMETLTVETSIPTVSSPVPTACLNDSPEPSSDARLISKRVANQEDTPSLDNILSLTNRFEDTLGVESCPYDAIGVEADVNNMETTITASPTPTLRIHKDHPKSQIIGPMDTSIQTRHKSKEVLKNKKDERGIVIRIKAMLVAQGHTHKEGIDYDEVFAPVAIIEVIRLFLAYASFMGFIVYQMDMKSAFLYGNIDEEVYMM
nr:copia protein [Tanacetum cinerariifolium]